MAVRRKLDRAGIKISLEQWRALGRGERLAICHLPANLEEEREALTLFINEAVGRNGGALPTVLSDADRLIAEPPADPPEELTKRAQDAGFALTAETWGKLDPDQRYALMKLGAGSKVSHDFEPALKEMLDSGVASTPASGR